MHPFSRMILIISLVHTSQAFAESTLHQLNFLFHAPGITFNSDGRLLTEVGIWDTTTSDNSTSLSFTSGLIKYQFNIEGPIANPDRVEFSKDVSLFSPREVWRADLKDGKPTALTYCDNRIGYCFFASASVCKRINSLFQDPKFYRNTRICSDFFNRMLHLTGTENASYRGHRAELNESPDTANTIELYGNFNGLDHKIMSMFNMVGTLCSKVAFSPASDTTVSSQPTKSESH